MTEGHKWPWWTALGSIAGAGALVVALLAWWFPRSPSGSDTSAQPSASRPARVTSSSTAQSVSVTDGPNFEVRFKVNEFHGWQTDLTTRPSVGLLFLVEYRNMGTVRQDNVVLEIDLPHEISYLPNTTRLGNSLHPDGVATNNIATDSGINIGSYAPGGNGWILFQAALGDEKAFSCGTRTLTPQASAETDNGRKSAEVVLRVNRQC